ncbi:DMT family transporter [Alicyclobacillus fastidiosus]|uniref:DMT family transporter n=1 Tax=Alicyclobacillus fastidiosus TaxID=392011 RepID=A0ABY6ZJ91_9BACL|nr:DMT family transporter [Alicyclobacillus fastidiosus]WAH42939.1 DMT family transporter [Alicyclobacillus fastidiosus]GMA64896.1 hypothetical protein GCM10025859_53360 [Alicyclobacillus fastidiosus]
MGEVMAFLSLLCFSCNVLLTKAASSRLNVQLGYFASICVNVFVALAMVCFEHGVLHNPFHWMWRGFIDYVVAGCLTTYIGRLTYFHAIARLGAAKASSIQVASPVFTVVLACLTIREVLSLVEWVGCLCTVLGLFFVTYVPGTFSKRREPASKREIETSVERLNASRDGSRTGKGNTFAFLSLSAYGAGNIFRGEGVRHWNDPVFGGFLGALVGLIAFIMTNPRIVHAVKALKNADKKALLMYCLGGLCTITAQMSVLFAMRYMPIGIVTVISMSQPLIVVPLTYLIFKETGQITRQTIYGSLITLVGLVLVVAV